MYKITNLHEFWEYFTRIRSFEDIVNLFELLTTPLQFAFALAIVGVLSVIFIFIAAIFRDNE